MHLKLSIGAVFLNMEFTSGVAEGTQEGFMEAQDDDDDDQTDPELGQEAGPSSQQADWFYDVIVSLPPFSAFTSLSTKFIDIQYIHTYKVVRRLLIGLWAHLYSPRKKEPNTHFFPTVFAIL